MNRIAIDISLREEGESVRLQCKQVNVKLIREKPKYNFLVHEQLGKAKDYLLWKGKKEQGLKDKKAKNANGHTKPRVKEDTQFKKAILDWNPPSPWTPWHRWWRWTYPCRKLLLGSDLAAGPPVHQLCTFRKKFLVNFCGSEWCSISWCILYALCMNSINLCKELVLPLIFVETLCTSSLFDCPTRWNISHPRYKEI